MTTFDSLFQVSNHGTQAVGLYIGDDGTDTVSFSVDGDSVEGSTNAATVEVGETVVVDLEVDTTGGDVPDDYSDITIVADETLAGTSASDSNTVYVSQSAASADYQSIQAAVDALATRSETTAIVAGETFDEDVKVTTSGVTLRSEGGTEVTGGFDLSADDVTLSGFTLSGQTSLYGSGNTAVYVRGTSGHSLVNNSFVSPTIDGEQTKGLLVQTNSNSTGLSVANNDFDGYTQGVYLNAQNEAAFTNNTFSNNVVGIAGIDTDSVATVTENVFEGNTTESVGVFNGDLEAHRNDFNASNAAAINNYGSTTVNAQNNWWGATSANDAEATINTNSADGPVNYQPFAPKPFNSATVSVAADDNLQQKINSARPGDTVKVAAGTFEGSIDVLADGLTLTGAGEGETVVDASGVEDYGLSVKSDGFTLSDLTVLGPPPETYGYGVKVSDKPRELTGVTVSSVTVQGSGRSELDFNYVSDVTIEDVTLDGDGTGGVGLGITECHDAEINGLTTTGNTWGGVGLYSYGPGDSSYVRDTDGVTFTGENSFGETAAVYEQPAENVRNVSIPSMTHTVSLVDGGYMWYFGSLQAAEDFVSSSDDLTTSNTSIEAL
ncbi:right-handed parallel beta-helix repeat-containing protein [Halobaculum litoreum]|uniref:Right-handed parallel beta-helix repeat-containing protein n=1 Tax=Halobaculum litoreum TaxID=3031998 RepID=A0ABD5XSK7_9EURY